MLGLLFLHGSRGGGRFDGFFCFLAVIWCYCAGDISESVWIFGVFVVAGSILAFGVALRTTSFISRSTSLRLRILFVETMTFGATAGTGLPLAVVAVYSPRPLGFHAEAYEIARAVQHGPQDWSPSALPKKISQRPDSELLVSCFGTGGGAELADAGEVLGPCAGALDVDCPFAGQGVRQAVRAVTIVE